MAEVTLSFWKMHGLGNDYIVVDGRREKNGDRDYPRISLDLCQRRFSVGADGLLVLCDAEAAPADYRMRTFNADGSEAEMCGNGIRCLAKFIYETHVCTGKSLMIETLAGLKEVHLQTANGIVSEVSVDMGAPLFERKMIPMRGEGQFIDQTLEVNGGSFKATCLSMGNPHCVTFVDDVDKVPLEKWGPKIEAHPLFPQRVNVEFVEVQDEGNIAVRTWERGCGETLACGTGACASGVVAHKMGKTDKKVTVHLLGGDLKILIGDKVIMTGSASKVFEGSAVGDW